MTENPQAQPDADLKRQLIRRVAFAGLLIAMLLGALALVDYLGQPAEEPEAAGPTFTAPVPVVKKEVSQPLKPVETEPGGAAPTAEAPPPEAPVAVPAAGEAPARPEFAAQPALPAAQPPRTGARMPAAAPPRVAESTAPAEGTAAASLPPPVAEPGRTVEAPRAAAPTAPAAEPPAPPRLLSGYAVQAGVFADAQHAEELRARLTLNGIPSTLEARVQVGPFKTRAEAEAARQKLKALGIDGLLLPPKGAKR